MASRSTWSASSGRIRDRILQPVMPSRPDLLKSRNFSVSSSAPFPHMTRSFAAADASRSLLGQIAVDTQFSVAADAPQLSHLDRQLTVDRCASETLGLGLSLGCKLRADLTRRQHASPHNSAAQADRAGQDASNRLSSSLLSLAKPALGGRKPTFRKNACSFMMRSKNRCSSRELTT